MKLAHLRLPSLTRYAHASDIQNRLVAAFLDAKASNGQSPSPDATIITAEFHPVYTCGRRERNTVSASQEAHLRCNGEAEFHEALRGGQTTFHGPGQLVAYPIIDLKQHGLNPRNYVCLLEDTLIKTCARYGIKGFRTENPGVWTSQDHKIAALGVHLRRNVTSHGIGLNVNTDLQWLKRIVACGLEGKFATSFEEQGVRDTTVDEVRDVFVEEFARGLTIEDCYEVTEKDLDHVIR